jgi:hypothetical protein
VTEVIRERKPATVDATRDGNQSEFPGISDALVHSKKSGRADEFSHLNVTGWEIFSENHRRGWMEMDLILLRLLPLIFLPEGKEVPSLGP